MPRFRYSGSFRQNGVNYRFMLTEGVREEPWKVFDRPGKALSMKAAVGLCMSTIVHRLECIHAAVKASTLLLGFGRGNEGKVYLVDIGLACPVHAKRQTQGVQGRSQEGATGSGRRNPPLGHAYPTAASCDACASPQDSAGWKAPGRYGRSFQLQRNCSKLECAFG
ncbi:hypothetical protein MTO96_024940 [Rhipicephalus appendiculatus]